MNLADHRSEIGIRIVRITGHKVLGRPLRNLQRVIVAITRHQHARRRVAGLPAIAETGLDTAGDGSFEISVGEDDVGRLSAKFLGDALDGIGGRLGNQNTCTGRAGEGHDVNIGMAAEHLADTGTIAIDQIEHAGGHTGLVHDLGKHDAAQGRDFARLEHHGTTRGQRRRHLGGNLVHRPVPRRDQSGHADSLMDNQGRAAHLFKNESLKCRHRRIEMAEPGACLIRQRKRIRRTHFHGNRLGDVTHPGFVNIANTREKREPFGGGPCTETRKRRARGGDGLFGILLGS